jgi:hypothetical protein
LMGIGYFASPTWRMVVEVRESELAVTRGNKIRLRLPWSQITRLVRDGDALFVDGGSPSQSLLIPAPKSRGSYVIEGAPELIAEIRAKCAAPVVEQSDVRAPNRSEP